VSTSTCTRLAATIAREVKLGAREAYELEALARRWANLSDGEVRGEAHALGDHHGAGLLAGAAGLLAAAITETRYADSLPSGARLAHWHSLPEVGTRGGYFDSGTADADLGEALGNLADLESAGRHADAERLRAAIEAYQRENGEG
jgi:hypothetical protein